jgi:hypothetical protein
MIGDELCDDPTPLVGLPVAAFVPLARRVDPAAVEALLAAARAVVAEGPAGRAAVAAELGAARAELSSVLAPVTAALLLQLHDGPPRTDMVVLSWSPARWSSSARTPAKRDSTVAPSLPTPMMRTVTGCDVDASAACTVASTSSMAPVVRIASTA